jgi:hypothetical protein
MQPFKVSMSATKHGQGVQVSVVLDPPLFDRVESARGLVPRTTYLRELVRKAIDTGLRVS